jgi:hypothetical protein
MTGLGALLGPTPPVVAPARRPVVTVRGEPMDTTAALLLRVLPMGQLGWPALSVPTGSTTACRSACRSWDARTKPKS